ESQPLSSDLTTQVQLSFAGEVAFVRLLLAPDRSSINGFSFNPCGSIEAVKIHRNLLVKNNFQIIQKLKNFKQKFGIPMSLNKIDSLDLIIINNKKSVDTIDIINNERSPWFILSYIAVSEKFFTIIKNINVKLPFRFQCQRQKLENADLKALLDENPAQSTSELNRESNVDCTTVIKRLYDMLFK
ncbi:hypothetical protein ALC60_09296, partial [Trachymyrmex zeteki]